MSTRHQPLCSTRCQNAVTRGEDAPREACGVFGIYSRSEDVARTTYFGLYALQHRGQESAGIAVSDGQDIRYYKAMGLVSQVFSEDILRQLQGHIAIGHNRYSTTGSSRLENAQPLCLDGPRGRVMIAHNGNISNAAPLRRDLEARGQVFRTTTDSELIAVLVATGGHDSWVANIRAAMSRLEGSYSLVLLTREALIGVRDPLGNRPLCLGRGDGAWVLASESCALETVGVRFEREVAPGEIMVIDRDGVHSDSGRLSQQQALCLFEYVYLARPDSIIRRRRVYQARWEMGRQLARERPAEADVVIGVPLCAITAAQAYAEEAGLPYRDGLVQNRYIHRTFIQPEQDLRQTTTQLKYNPVPEVVAGQRVVVVDDSIVRGTSQEQIVRLLRRAGAREVHLRISCPPLRHPCVLGVDMATYEELIAHRVTLAAANGRNSRNGAATRDIVTSLQELPTNIAAIQRHVGADTLGYLSLEGLISAVGIADDDLCTACWNGTYPVPVQLSLAAASAKFGLESARR